MHVSAFFDLKVYVTVLLYGANVQQELWFMVCQSLLNMLSM